MAKANGQKRIKIIPEIHGKVTSDHKVSEPDIYWILEKWLERHPEITKRQKDIRVTHGQWTTEDGLRTEVIAVSIVAGNDIAGYDPEQDADLGVIPFTTPQNKRMDTAYLSLGSAGDFRIAFLDRRSVL